MNRNEVYRNILRERGRDYCILELEIRPIRQADRTLRREYGICALIGEVITKAEYVRHSLGLHEPLFEWNGKVYTCEGAGQFIDEMVDFFPEIIPYLKKHMQVVAEGEDESWVQTICPDDQSWGKDLPKLSYDLYQEQETQE